MPTEYPKWLNEQAAKYYARIMRQHPNFNLEQKDLVCLMADAWETYQSAKIELQNYFDEFGKLTQDGKPHSAFLIQKQQVMI